MKTTLLLIFISLAASVGFAQEEKETAAVDPNIRPAGEVVLKFEHKIEIPEIKRLSDDGVLEIFPGDIVHLEFQEADGDLINPKVVADVTHPQRSITFKMTQDESITMLSRNTKIQQTVALDCTHRGMRSEDFSPTNLRPTEKGLSSFDSWPNTVWILRLSNIEVTSRSASEVYAEKVSAGREGETNSEQDGAGQPATAPESEPEGGSKPDTDAEGRSQ